MPTTEIATVTLTPGSDVGDPNNNASKVVNECGNLLTKVPGFQRMRFGMVIEDQSQLQLFIDWDSKQNQDDFIASDAFPGFLERINTIKAGPPSFRHVDFEGDLNGALSAPVTEVATFYFQIDTPDSYTERVHKFIETCQREEPGTKLHGYAIGSTYETIEKDGVKGKGGVLLIGWDSVEAHMKFRKLGVFQREREMMRQGAGAIEVHHAQMMNFVAS